MVSARQASWIAGSVDVARPNAARMHDFFLGGAHNFTADRHAALAILAVAPEIRDAAYANRMFLRRAVRYALAQGIDQFLDLGCGFPAVGSVHEILRAADPDARVLYVDLDPVVVGHAQALLDGADTAAAIEADLCNVPAILGHDQTRRLIDFDRPVAVLLVSVLHFVGGAADDLARVIADVMCPAAPGSLLAISHASEVVVTEQTAAMRQLYGRTPTPLHLRRPGEIKALFTGLELITPHPHAAAAADLVPVLQWRRDPGDGGLPPQRAISPFLTGFLAGAAHKPASPSSDATPTAHAVHPNDRTIMTMSRR